MRKTAAVCTNVYINKALKAAYQWIMFKECLIPHKFYFCFCISDCELSLLFSENVCKDYRILGKTKNVIPKNSEYLLD